MMSAGGSCRGGDASTLDLFFQNKRPCRPTSQLLKTPVSAAVAHSSVAAICCTWHRCCPGLSFSVWANSVFELLRHRHKTPASLKNVDQRRQQQRLAKCCVILSSARDTFCRLRWREFLEENHETRVLLALKRCVGETALIKRPIWCTF